MFLLFGALVSWLIPRPKPRDREAGYIPPSEEYLDALP
jgi:hypothetical protein